MLRGIYRVHGELRGSVAGFLENYTKGALSIQRDYQIRRALVEGLQDVTIQDRAKLRQAVKVGCDRELEKLREQLQAALTEVRLYVATVGDGVSVPGELVPDWRECGRDELARAQRVIDVMRGG